MQTTASPSETPFGLCRLIGQTRAEIVLGIERALVGAGVDLNFSQFLALKRLGEEGSMAPGELARILNYNPGALTRLLDKLEQSGYLQRAPDPDDRRALRLELTASGREIHAKIIACCNTEAERVFAGITPAERRQLHGLLVRVLHDLQDMRERIDRS